MRRVVAGVALAVTLIAISSCRTRERAAPRALATATFAGGCFWSMVEPFEKLPGVVRVTAGYCGGDTANPDYARVSSGGTGHRESVEVTYDPTAVSYAKLLDTFWHNVDPLDDGGQFCDRGAQYQTAIFVHGPEQKKLADASKQSVEAQLRSKVMTDVVAAGKFYPAEEYHQDYYKKNSVRYRVYRLNCGRDARLARIWGSAPEHS